MKKSAFAVVIALVSFVSVFSEIKFQKPVQVWDYFGIKRPFSNLAVLGDTVYTNWGLFNASNGDTISMAGHAAVDMMGVGAAVKDNKGNVWCCFGGPNAPLTVIDRSGNQTTYPSAAGRNFGNIRSINFSEGEIIIGCDSGISITTPVNGAPSAWTNFSTKVIKEVVAKRGQIWAISYSDFTVGEFNLYRDSSGTLLSYDNILPVAGDWRFVPDHCDIDTAGNFWLSYHRFINGGINTEEAGLLKFDGKNWTKYFATTFNFSSTMVDTIALGIIRVDKYNQLWFVNDVLTDVNTFSLGKIDLASMKIEKINYIGVMNPSTGANYPAPLSWTPFTVTITSSGQALFGGLGCFVPVDYGNSAVLRPMIAKTLVIANQKNLNGYIFDPLGRRIASANSFSRNLSAGNYYSWPVNGRKAGNISVLK